MKTLRVVSVKNGTVTFNRPLGKGETFAVDVAGSKSGDYNALVVSRLKRDGSVEILTSYRWRSRRGTR